MMKQDEETDPEPVQQQRVAMDNNVQQRVATDNNNVQDDHADDDDSKTEQGKADAQKQAASTSNKSMEDMAKEFYAFVVDSATKMKTMNKKDWLLIKQQIVTKAMHFYRRLVDYVQNKATPDLLEAKTYVEMRAKAFARKVVDMAKQINQKNMLIVKQLVEVRSKELILVTIKFMTDPNYRALVVKQQTQPDQLQKHGRVGLLVLGAVMITMAAFGHGAASSSGIEGVDGSFLFTESGGVRGRSLASEVATKLLPSPLSLKSSPNSLHPKWKLWHDMTVDQQHKALEELQEYFEKYGRMIGLYWHKDHLSEDEICPLVDKKTFVNTLCEIPPTDDESCNFMSFLANDGDDKFERAIGDKFKCKGFVASPIHSKQSKLGPNVSFQNIGVSQFRPVDDHKAVWNTSIPIVQQFLGLEHSDVLRLSCEGCEIALTKDVLTQDPSFFQRFDQISVMKHASKQYVDSEEELYYFGLMFPLLEEAGHLIVNSKVVGCRGKTEATGCRPEFNEWGYTCGKGANDSEKASRSCQDFLFAKEHIAIRPPNPETESA